VEGFIFPFWLLFLPGIPGSIQVRVLGEVCERKGEGKKSKIKRRKSGLFGWGFAFFWEQVDSG